MRGSKKFCQRGSKIDKMFLVDEGNRDSNATIIGPSLARKQNAILMAFRWRANYGPTLNTGSIALRFYMGSGPVLLRNPLFL